MSVVSEAGDTVRGMELSDVEQAMLEFERSWWKYPGAKDTAIMERFGCSATRYYQRLNALIDRPESMAFDPMLVKRLRRLREMRRAHRSRVAATFEA